MIGNLGPILSGITMSAVSKQVAARISNDEAAFEVSLKVLTGAMTVAGGIVGCLHWLTYLLNEREASVSTDDAVAPSAIKTSASGSKDKGGRELATVEVEGKVMTKQDRKKLSFLESIQVLAADPYLSQVAVMVLSYGLTMEFTEIIWKASVKKAFPIKTDYLGNTLLSPMNASMTLVIHVAFVVLSLHGSIQHTGGFSCLRHDVRRFEHGQVPRLACWSPYDP